MHLLSYLITGIFIGGIDFLFFDKNKKLLALIRKVFLTTITLNTVSIGILYFIFKMNYLFSASTYRIMSFFIKYIIFTIVIGIAYLIIKTITKVDINFKSIKGNIGWKGVLSRIVLILLFAIGATFVFFSNWFRGYFGEITPEQFLFNLSSPIKGTSSDMAKEIISSPVTFIILSIVVFTVMIIFGYGINIKLKNNKEIIINEKVITIIICFIAIFSLVAGVNHGVKKLRLDEVYAVYTTESTYIEDNCADPRNTKITFPEKKRNLIHIYLESIESSFLSKELGGYMAENLMPELTELSKEGIHFSNTDKFGGANQTYGSSWSVAGMVNMDMGIPLKIAMDGNSYGKEGVFLPGAIGIGDILNDNGYEQTIMFGADADFGGLTTYFTTHGNFNIFDHKYAIEKGLIPSEYNVWWGFEDKKLYEFAKEEILRLSQTGKPFNFTMETADTHFPDGYLEEDAPKKYESQYANVIAYSTQKAVEFIKWIQQQPFYEDTTIVITGDHLGMDKTFFEDFDETYDRRTFNLILNSPITTEKVFNREFATYDMFPTILASMGVEIEGDRLGLGTNLFSGKPTLIERDGFEGEEEGLSYISEFYIEKLLKEQR